MSTRRTLYLCKKMVEALDKSTVSWSFAEIPRRRFRITFCSTTEAAVISDREGRSCRLDNGVTLIECGLTWEARGACVWSWAFKMDTQDVPQSDSGNCSISEQKNVY